MATQDSILIFSDALGRTGEELIGAFVFGSVARGSASPASVAEVANVKSQRERWIEIRDESDRAIVIVHRRNTSISASR